MRRHLGILQTLNMYRRLFCDVTVPVVKKQKCLMVRSCCATAACGQSFCFSLSRGLSLSAQVCPGHMSANPPPPPPTRTAAIVLRERVSQWWRERKRSVSANILTHASCSSIHPLAASGRGKHLHIHQSVLCVRLSWKKEFHFQSLGHNKDDLVQA